ncbi:MAG: HEAT repeat domain-containing protein [Chloroflexi bacterium]|nr:MAG: HEAT repeat domain-containing protein [Chloroflexota bacterium]
MRDIWYDHLIQESQSADREHRLDAWRDLCKEEYLDKISAQYLLDRLNSTENWQEQSAILGLMCRIKDPLPIDALSAILEDWETSDAFLRMDVARVLARVQAEEALDLYLRVLMDHDEHPWLREIMTSYLPMWGSRVADPLLPTLLADPQSSVVTAALEVVRDNWPPDAIPLETVLSFRTHERSYVREAALKTLLAASLRVPPDAILSALHDPEPEVRAVASHACISLVEWFEDLPLEPLLEALGDEYPSVREDILDAFGKVPLRIPAEPVIAALSDPVNYVRCAAIETLGVMGERVPSSVYPVLQEMAGTDTSAHVRQRATRTLLVLHGIDVAPLRLPVIEITTLEDLEE